MSRRRPRLVPKVVFGVALGASAVVPVLGGCQKEPVRGVAYMGNPVAAQGYDNPPPADPCPGGKMLPVGTGPDAGTACVQVGVAATAYQNPPPVPAGDAGAKK